jgi:hypothetical protein
MSPVGGRVVDQTAVAWGERLRAARPSITREMPVMRRFTPTRVPMAHVELDGQ